MSKFQRGHVAAARLTADKVIEIRRLYAEEGWTQGRLCRHFGVSVGQIGRIVRGESWQRYTQIPHEQEIEDRLATAEPVGDAEIAASLARLSDKLRAPDKLSEEIDPLEEIMRRRSQPAASQAAGAALAGILDGIEITQEEETRKDDSYIGRDSEPGSEGDLPDADGSEAGGSDNR